MLTWVDGSVKWALLDFQADLAPAQDHRLTLSWAGTDENREQPSTPVGFRETADGTLFIETGQNQWAMTAGVRGSSGRRRRIATST